MLEITVPKTELWNEAEEKFIYIKEQTLRLEHSLVSISKWEQKWHKPFLGKDHKTNEQIIDYIRCMTLNQHVDPYVYTCLTEANMLEINAYIDDPMTATTFSAGNNSRNSEVITNEIIYYWMTVYKIPVEFQKWHINRLLTLIRVCSVKSQPPKKRSTKEIMSRNAALNAERRKRLNSKG